jgi:chloramphenicol-sensitive protein RarD
VQNGNGGDSAVSAETAAPNARAGVIYGLGAYTLWGLFPLYLRLVREVAPVEFLMHRIVWSAVLLCAILAVRRQWGWLRLAFRSPRGPRILGSFAASALFLSLNWFVYVWAAHADRVVDASLGYFINPLVSVALGAAFLGERLRRAQTVAVALASLGVVWLIVQVGQIPWIGLALAGSFGMYGLLRKTAALGALEGLALETLLLFPVAVATLGWLAAHGRSGFVSGGSATRLFVLLAGPATTVPLLLFAASARRLPLWVLGLLQYVGPTLQLLSGVLVLGEPFGGAKLVGYGFIWLGFGVASVDGLRAHPPAPGLSSTLPASHKP